MPTQQNNDLFNVDWSRVAKPSDDGAYRHLVGATLPDLALMGTSGKLWRLAELTGITVVFCFPRMGQPGKPALVDDWDAIPGARGCTPQACSYRDEYLPLIQAGVSKIFGLATSSHAYLCEAATRLSLPYELLTDHAFALTNALALPTFDAAGQRLLKRAVLLCVDRQVRDVIYPVFPPDQSAVLTLARVKQLVVP